jgi:allantoinase
MTHHGDFIIRSLHVVTPDGTRPASIRISRGVIQSVRPYDDVPEGVPVTELGDLFLLPGLVDVHVHCNEPGRTEWEGFESATRAAAAGGITTLVDMPLNSSPVTTTLEALHEKLAATKNKLSTDVAFHAGLIHGNGKSIGDLIDAGCVAAKAFLVPSGIDEFPSATEQDLRDAMPELAKRKVPLLVHAELESPLPVTSNQQPVTTYAAYLASRPNSWEHSAIAMMIRLCRETRCPVHIVHLAAADALPMLIEARKEGLPITVETCPHYLYFDSHRIPDGDTRFKCAPPIRDAANRVHLWHGLLAGDIDLVASDHSPCEPSLKKLDLGDFAQAWGGIASLQYMLPIVWTVAKHRGAHPDSLARWLSAAPAKLVRLDKKKGAIAAGRDADLVVFDPEAAFIVSPDSTHHRHKLTPYEGERLTGVVQATYLRGVKVYENGSFPSPPAGRTILRTPPTPLERLNSLPPDDAREELTRCCGSRKWVAQMLRQRPFADTHALFEASHKSFTTLTRDDWMEAFSHHPKIGDLSSLRKKFASTATWASGEQSAASAASEDTLKSLAKANERYEGKFGYIFIVCATGKSAPEMLAILESRLPNPGDKELSIAAEEQKKITRIRLEKLLAPSSP